MSFSPNKEDLEAGMEGVVARLEETLLCIKPLVMDPLFFPFTRPVLYGKQEDMVFKVQTSQFRSLDQKTGTFIIIFGILVQ